MNKVRPIETNHSTKNDEMSEKSSKVTGPQLVNSISVSSMLSKFQVSSTKEVNATSTVVKKVIRKFILAKRYMICTAILMFSNVLFGIGI